MGIPRLRPCGRFIAALLIASAPFRAAEYYVSPLGSRSGDGSVARPWSLAHALAHPAVIQPGDTIWLRGGLYAGAYTSRLMGMKDAPIVVRQYPGERAVLDGINNDWNVPALRIEGAFTTFWGFEITHSGPRQLNNARSHAIDLYAPGSRLINLVIHDTGQGLGVWMAAADSEVYGNIVYNNGWTATDRGHGHGIYTQNEAGWKTFEDNVVFGSFSFNFHAYGSEAARLNNFRLLGNVFFDGPFLVGGSPPANAVELDQNCFYRANVSLGFDNQNNSDLTVTNNYVANYLYLKWWNNVRVTGNTVYPAGQTGQDASVSITLRPGGRAADYFLDQNTYYQGPARDGWDFYFVAPGERGVSNTFPMWQSAFNYDRASTFIPTATKRPSGTRVFVRPNRYETGRGHVVIYNWDHLDEVEVDLSSLGFTAGESYELRNVQNYLRDRISGVYNGAPIRVPMTGWTAAAPVGQGALSKPSTFPEFGVFLVTKATSIEPGRNEGIRLRRPGTGSATPQGVDAPRDAPRRRP